MSQEKYIGMDVHQATISVAVMDAQGKLIMECLLETKAVPLSRTRWHRHPPRRKLMSMGNRPSFSREAKLQWAGSREKKSRLRSRQNFFLDIPFYRTH